MCACFGISEPNEMNFSKSVGDNKSTCPAKFGLGQLNLSGHAGPKLWNPLASLKPGVGMSLINALPASLTSVFVNGIKWIFQKLLEDVSQLQLQSLVSDTATVPTTTPV